MEKSSSHGLQPVPTGRDEERALPQHPFLPTLRSVTGSANISWAPAMCRVLCQAWGNGHASCRLLAAGSPRRGARARRGDSQRLASPSSTPPALPTPPCAVFMPSSRPACRALAPRPVHGFGASGVGVLGFPARQLPTTHPPEGGGGREQADRPAPFPRSARRAPPPIKP